MPLWGILVMGFLYFPGGIVISISLLKLLGKLLLVKIDEGYAELLLWMICPLMMVFMIAKGYIEDGNPWKYK
jgi:hypothetical protein